MVGCVFDSFCPLRPIVFYISVASVDFKSFYKTPIIYVCPFASWSQKKRADLVNAVLLLKG